MRLIFCGTPRFAVPTLDALLASGFEIPLVLTNPDEPQGRGYQRTPPPVKRAALEAGLAVLQPARLKDARDEIERIQPDVVVVVAYGHLVPQWMIDLPPLGCINLHASLLPRYRGAAPIAWAIMRGERVTGVTTMKIDAGMDTGDILLQTETLIGDDDTAETLAARLSAQGAGLMKDTLARLISGEINPRPQEAALATLAPMLKKTDGWVDWSLPAAELALRVRGLIPWPVAHTAFRGKQLKIWAARALELQGAASPAPGSLEIRESKLIAGSGGGTALEILELQLEGRARVHTRDFLNGVHLRQGETLGWMPRRPA